MFHSSQRGKCVKAREKNFNTIWTLNVGQGPSFNANSDFCGKKKKKKKTEIPVRLKSLKFKLAGMSASC